MSSRETPRLQERPLAELSEIQRDRAMARFAVLRPHLEDGIPLAQASRAASVALRTAERWLSRYRSARLIGLARTPRTDGSTTARRETVPAHRRPLFKIVRPFL